MTELKIELQTGGIDDQDDHEEQFTPNLEMIEQAKESEKESKKQLPIEEVKLEVKEMMVGINQTSQRQSISNSIIHENSEENQETSSFNELDELLDTLIKTIPEIVSKIALKAPETTNLCAQILNILHESVKVKLTKLGSQLQSIRHFSEIKKADEEEQKLDLSSLQSLPDLGGVPESFEQFDNLHIMTDANSQEI